METRNGHPYTSEANSESSAPLPVSIPQQPSLFESAIDLPSVEPVEAIMYAPDQAVVMARSDGQAFWEEAKSFMRDLIFSILVAVLVIVFVIQPVRVEGTSMLPHLHDGERIFVNKFVYTHLGEFFFSTNRIERGDIVVFWYPNDPEKSFIKRVIGLPGETVSIRDGVVYVNGQPIDESYIDDQYHNRPDNMAAKFIQPHYFFVMGDNRDSSNDSRQWGLVPEKYIYGKAIFRYWPPSSVGTIN